MKAIRTYRTRFQMSQAQLAALVHVDQTAVSKWESGVMSPRLKTLQKIALIFNCSLDDLLSDRPPAPSRGSAPKQSG